MPCFRVGALRADVEGHPVRAQTQPSGLQHQLIGVVDARAELARQRDHTAAVVDLKPDVYRRPRRLRSDLGRFTRPVEGETPHTCRVGCGDMGRGLTGLL